MPFAKRLVEPQLLCRRYQVPNDDHREVSVFEDLVSISNVALARTLRQLSDLAKHACSIFQELEGDLEATTQRLRGLQRKVGRLQQTCSDMDPKQEAVPVSNLDVESKLTLHYRAPWHKQRNVFRPSTRPACVEELHREANLWVLHRDHERRRWSSREGQVTISISALPPMPMYPSTPIARRKAKKGARLTWAAPSDPADCDGASLGHRSKLPVPNTPSTLDKQTNWSAALPLPTPEERMKCDSRVINSCVIPINVTGVGFDRDASVRCSLVHSHSLLQRRRKLRRRRTVAGVPRQVQLDLDSDDSPGSRERTVIVHATLDVNPFNEDLTSHLGTRDSGCQTEDFLISGAPSRRRIHAQRGHQGAPLCLSQSAGNIAALRDSRDNMFAAAMGTRLRSRSLPRDGNRTMENGHIDDVEAELSPFSTEDFLQEGGEIIHKNEEGSADDRVGSECLKYKPLLEMPERGWMERTRSQLPRKADMGSCDMSSSSDTFSSPVHSVSATGVLGGQMDHKDDHQSSSGNWSGSSSTCPSQTSETLPPAASPPLTGSLHGDSELSLNTTPHANEEHASFMLDPYTGLRTQRAGSFSSTAMDILEEAGVSTPVEGEWNYTHPDPSGPQDFSPEPSRETESSLGCPSFTSMATCESSFSDKPPSEKADTVSHYSLDTEGYYTSMHFDCGLKGSRSFTYNYAASSSNASLLDFSRPMTLGESRRRCLSLRKAKAKPCPPKRSSSLRKICSEGNIPILKEPKISCGQQPPLSKENNLQLVLSTSAGRIGNSSLAKEPLRVWGVESSSDLPDLGVFSSTDAHSFKDEGVVQANYADFWLLNDLKSGDPYRSLSNSSTATGTTVIECVKAQDSSESQTSQSGSRATTPSLPSVEGDFKMTSPERLAGLASPSSGYSSQSETPTSSFPAAFFPGPLSPSSGKRKPKVPERKSSLSSSSDRNGATSKRDLELPIIPPPHLDLSAFHNVSSKTPSHWTHQQNKQKDLPKAETFNSPSMSITPAVLHSVQLRSVSKEQDGGPDYGPKPDCPTVNSSSTPASFESPHFVGEPALPSNEDLRHSGTLKSAKSPTPDDEWAEITQLSPPPPGEDLCPLKSSVVTTLHHSSPLSLHVVPVADAQLQVLQVSPDSEEVESAGDASQSASQDGAEEDTTTEELFSKDLTPSDSSSSQLSDEWRSEDDSVFLSPTKTRTTDDLFAVIHRSKRKVLGRKDSSEAGVRNRLGTSSSTTPPSSATSSPGPTGSPCSLQKAPGPIYRNAKKSSTSNEEFKMLLLKKGSRSESSYRMSATEILKSPVTPKGGDCVDELASPLQTALDVPATPYPKANAEGFSPRSFFSPASSRQGRSRIPPPANSSRYGARSRMYSVPMQAISEGETENSDGSPHDERSSSPGSA
ncbi:actin remodeling regulator NHS isoform X2 [Dunckerocampus dactyliophorus]|uniref:actin remodeling regulator NHS isoform X2 n=1 Tax=Dunckerocampus dactyliophorus TaxID=161453 RepID=UPI002406E42D|nr:actin remodeling regulator NHS isoform X2 [Dunckerocampus dactyliophorus]